MKNLLCYLLLFICLSSIGQDKVDTITQTSKNNVYLELYGQAGFYSLNYERIFIPKKRSFLTAVRVGGSFLNINHSLIGFTYFGIPISYSSLFGKQRHKIEMGLGSCYEYFDSRATGSGLRNSIIVGYRLQPIEKDVIIRISYCPFNYFSFSDQTSYFQHWGGFSFGYSF